MHLAGTGQLQAGPEDARAADAVDVVIAVDDDRPVFADRPDDPLGRLDDSRQRLGIVQAAELGLEEGHGPLRLLDPPVDQQLGDQRRDPGAPAESAAIRPESNGLSRHRVVIGASFAATATIPSRESRRAGAGEGLRHALSRDRPMITQSRSEDKGAYRGQVAESGHQRRHRGHVSAIRRESLS